MTHENEYYVYIIEPLEELMRVEFGSTKIRSDMHKGTSFLVKDMPFTLDDIRNRGEIYQYEIEIVYEHKGGKFDRIERKHLSNIAERVKKLVHNYRDFSVEVNWIDEGGTWGNTTHTWGSDESTYCWHGGVIAEVDFEQDEDIKEGHYQVKLIFQCLRESRYDSN